jgi:ATP-dependent Clp protease ATP-binding subunit ClpA
MATTAVEEAVTCPNCSVQTAYPSLNTHLDECLGLKANKRLSEAQENGHAVATKKSKVEPSRLSQVAQLATSTSTAMASNTSIVASTSRERLDSVAPLAERLRPKSLDDFVGQDGVVNGPLKALLQRGTIPNAILWGPPGTGECAD